MSFSIIFLLFVFYLLTCDIMACSLLLLGKCRDSQSLGPSYWKKKSIILFEWLPIQYLDKLIHKLVHKNVISEWTLFLELRTPQISLRVTKTSVPRVLFSVFRLSEHSNIFSNLKSRDESRCKSDWSNWKLIRIWLVCWTPISRALFRLWSIWTLQNGRIRGFSI